MQKVRTLIQLSPYNDQENFRRPTGTEIHDKGRLNKGKKEFLRWSHFIKHSIFLEYKNSAWKLLRITVIWVEYLNMEYIWQEFRKSWYIRDTFNSSVWRQSGVTAWSLASPASGQATARSRNRLSCTVTPSGRPAITKKGTTFHELQLSHH